MRMPYDVHLHGLYINRYCSVYNDTLLMVWQVMESCTYRGSHVPALPPIDSPTSQPQSSSRGVHQHRFKSSPHTGDSTPKTRSAVLKDGQNVHYRYSPSQLTWRDEGITCSPSLFMQLEDRVAMLEQVSRTHQEELVQVRAVVRGRQGSMMEDTRQLRSSMDVQGATMEVVLSNLQKQLRGLGEEQDAMVREMAYPSLALFPGSSPVFCCILYPIFCTVCDKKLGRSLGTRLPSLSQWIVSIVHGSDLCLMLKFEVASSSWLQALLFPT